MARKPRPKNAADAHLRIDKNSATWLEVRTYAMAIISRACAILDDPGSPVVDIHVAQGDKRTALGLLRLANPEAKAEVPDVPELYLSGGPED